MNGKWVVLKPAWNLDFVQSQHGEESRQHRISGQPTSAENRPHNKDAEQSGTYIAGHNAGRALAQELHQIGTLFPAPRNKESADGEKDVHRDDTEREPMIAEPVQWFVIAISASHEREAMREYYQHRRCEPQKVEVIVARPFPKHLFGANFPSPRFQEHRLLASII
jgi:hypothetical protein